MFPEYDPPSEPSDNNNTIKSNFIPDITTRTLSLKLVPIIINRLIDLDKEAEDLIGSELSELTNSYNNDALKQRFIDSFNSHDLEMEIEKNLNEIFDADQLDLFLNLLQKKDGPDFIKLLLEFSTSLENSISNATEATVEKLKKEGHR